MHRNVYEASAIFCSYLEHNALEIEHQANGGGRKAEQIRTARHFRGFSQAPRSKKSHIGVKVTRSFAMTSG